ncbi:MAG: hypothetical protein J7503_01190 [Cellulomonas iranensis]|uniref:Uncharacterized protein n=1 Tax=Cellulomonas iranensis TaxID=76862 RepID=A0ABU0GJ25_9CELL|nr:MULTISPECIES: hypothetical protein [Cellulomonas]MBO9567412.1 hypothetical protein [Cellulomonas iranensis]MDQ0425370.1 hypothetical protein [Cellulomonas iranensis]TFH71105.1 hypothetical protein E4A51_09610 [Cellulomonas sp. HD19AZ1]
MTATTSLTVALALVAFAALYVARAWGPERLRLKDRTGAVAESVGLLTLFVLSRTFVGWAGVPVLLWVAAVALAAVGAAGAVLRWGSVPGWRPRRRAWFRVLRLGGAALVCGTVLVLGAAAF